MSRIVKRVTGKTRRVALERRRDASCVAAVAVGVANVVEVPNGTESSRRRWPLRRIRERLMGYSSRGREALPRIRRCWEAAG